MTTPSSDRLVQDYLDRLDRAAASLPTADRRELVDQIREHVAAARADAVADGLVDGPAFVRTVLDRLGPPAEVAGAAGAEGETPPRPTGTREVVAVVLLTVGWALAGVGWLIGLVLAWSSPLWSTREKVVATLLSAPLVVALLVSHLVMGGADAVFWLPLVGLAVSVVAALRLVRGTLRGGVPSHHAV